MWLTLKRGLIGMRRSGRKSLRDGVIRQTQDAIEFAKGKRQSGLFGSFTKQLVLDGQITDLEHILGNESLNGSGTVLDTESGTILLVRGRCGSIVLSVQETGDTGAILARDPEV